MISEQKVTVDAAALTPGSVNVSVQIDAPIDRVWQSLTEPKVVAQWFGQFDSELVSGGSARLDFGDGDFFDLDSISLSPPYSIEYGWRFLGIGPRDSITWNIRPKGNGCLVTVNDTEEQRTPEAVMMLREGWIDFTSRLVDFHATGQNTRYDWRRELDVGLAINGSIEDVWSSLFSPDGQTQWLPFDSALESGVTATVSDEAEPRVVCFDQVAWQQGRQVEFQVRSELWTKPTICRAELTARKGEVLVYVSHNGWEGISDDQDEQLAQRKRFCALWIDALTRAREIAEASLC